MIKKLRKIKKKNNKAFTLVELLATIALIGILLLVGISSLTKLRDSILEKQYEALVDTIYAAGNKYYSKTTESIVYIDTLVKSGYLESDGEVIDPVNNKVLNNFYINVLDGDKHLYYCDDKGNCGKIYENHDNDKTAVKGSGAYEDSFVIEASIMDASGNYKPSYTSSNDDDAKWSNNTVRLEITGGLNSTGNLVYENNYVEITYTWYNKNDPSKPLTTFKRDKNGNIYKDGSITKDGIHYDVDGSESINATYAVYIKLEDISGDKTGTKGNVITFMKDINVIIDVDKPKIVSFDYSNKDNHKVKVSVIDSESGIKSVQLVSPTGAIEDKSNSLSYNSSDGTSYFEFEETGGTYKVIVYDNAGNWNEAYKTFEAFSCDIEFLGYEDNGNRESIGSSTVGSGVVKSSDKKKTLNEMIPSTDIKDIKDYYINSTDYLIGFNIASVSGGNENLEFKGQTINETIDSFFDTSYLYAGFCKKAGDTIKISPLVQSYQYNVKYQYTDPDFDFVTSGSVKKSMDQDIFNTNTYYQIPSDNDLIVVPVIRDYYWDKLDLLHKDAYFAGWSNGDDILYAGDRLTTQNFRDIEATQDDNDNYRIKTITLTTEWSTDKKYKITFDYNGGYFNDKGAANPTIIGVYNFQFSLKTYSDAAFNEDGNLVIAGWCTKASCSGLFNKTYGVDEVYKIKGKKTLYAKWKSRTYKITYNTNGGTWSNGTTNPYVISNLESSTYIISDNPVKEGADFKYWRTSTNIFGTVYRSGEEYTAGDDLTLYAIYEKKLTISYSAPGAVGNIPPTQYVSFLGSATVSDKTPIYDSEYEFYNWKSGITTYERGETIPIIISSKTLTAQTMKINKTVSYDPGKGKWINRGDSSIITTNANGSGSITINPNDEPYYEGYEFVGWKMKSGSCTDCSAFYNNVGDKVTVLGDVTFEAKYDKLDGTEVEEEDNPTYCYIYYYNMDGTNDYAMDGPFECSTKQMLYTLDDSDIESGYTFKGWNTGKNCSGTSYTNSVKFDNSKTLYACLEKKETERNVTITFNTGGSNYTDTDSYSITKNIGTSYKLPTLTGNKFKDKKSVTKSYMVFNGWTCSGFNNDKSTYSGGEKVEITSSASNKITCTASWYNICTILDSDIDFGTKINIKTGKYNGVTKKNYTGPWINAKYWGEDWCNCGGGNWSTPGGSTDSTYNGGVPRVCVGTNCQTYGIFGMTSVELYDDYGCTNYAKVWCSCYDSENFYNKYSNTPET